MTDVPSCSLQSSVQVLPGVRESVLPFSVDGQILKGILTLPSQQPPKGVIVFSHGWSGFRSGPADILTELCRQFAQDGYASYRFDYRGRGESQGKGLETTLSTMSDDLVAAVRTALAETGFQTVILCGLCSGGNVVVGSLKRIPKTEAVLLLSVYPFSDGDAFGRDMHRTFHYLKLYGQKLLRKDTWSRFIQGDVSLKAVFNVIFGHFLKRGTNRKKEAALSSDTPSQPSTQLPQAAKAAAVESRSQTKDAPKKHLSNLRSDLKGIMLYGSKDPDAQAAIRYFGDYISSHQLPIQIQTIDGANHNFSSQFWRTEVHQLCSDFLTSFCQTSSSPSVN